MALHSTNRSTAAKTRRAPRSLDGYAQVIQLRRPPGPEARPVATTAHEQSEGAGGDWPFVACLVVAFIVAATRMGVAIARREVFGVDASLATAFVFAVPLLLREPVSRLLRARRVSRESETRDRAKRHLRSH